MTSAEAQEVAVLHEAKGLAGTPYEDGDLGRLKACEKIVIGDGGTPGAGLLPKGIQSWPRTLKVLHLWGISDLRALPSFEDCPELETIDISGCSSLEELPALEHLEQLEWLDCKGCSSLGSLPSNPPPSLQFLYLEQCTALSHEDINDFLRELGRANQTPQLVELDLSGTQIERLAKWKWPGYWNAEDNEVYDHQSRWQSRRWLEKIVLRDCDRLTTIGLPLEQLPNLRHLNVSGCTKLQEIPSLPVVPAYPAPWPQKVMQYLQVDGSGIVRHAGSDIRPRHRKEGTTIPATHRNAAEAFLTLQHLGDPVLFPECRLMVLGNSMAGKTALIRRLIYGLEGQDPEGYVEPMEGREAWQPVEGMKSTHPIHCPTWRVGLDGFDEPATVHVWDYGGQHKYHRSHRNFVGEGTLFLLVWRHPGKEISEKDKERNKDLFEEEETALTLEYWLDFIVACGVCEPSDLRKHVVVVCTQSHGLLHEDVSQALNDQLGHHAGQGLEPIHFVESVDLDCADRAICAGWKSFHKDLRSKLVQSIETNGARVPAFYREMAGEVAKRRRTCEAWRAEDPHLIPSSADAIDDSDRETFWSAAFPDEEQWADFVSSRRGARLEGPHLRAITRNLHESGSLFWLHPPGRPKERFVLVDQGLALEWVYEFFSKATAKKFQDHCRKHDGWFTRDNLWRDGKKSDNPVRLFDSTWQEDRALDMLDQCRLVLPFEDKYLASEDLLLPDFGEVQAQVHQRRFKWMTSGSAVREGLHGSDRHPIGEGVFQDFRAWFLQELRGLLKPETFHLYRAGFQIEVSNDSDWATFDKERRDAWPERFLLEAFWLPNQEAAYGGRIHIRLDAPDEGGAERLWEVLNGEKGLWKAQGCPLGSSLEAGQDHSGTTPLLLQDAAAREVFPFGISCRKANPIASDLYEHLIGQSPSLPAFYYRGEEILKEIGDDHTEKVLGKLCASEVMVLIINEDYLEPEMSNRYCLEELAMTAFRYDRQNWRRLSERLRDLGAKVPEICASSLGRLHKNANTHRSKDRTLLFLEGMRRADLPAKMMGALRALHAGLAEHCNGLEVDTNPHWFFKRELLGVLLEAGGITQFNSELVDTSAALSDVQKLRDRISTLANGLPHA